MNNDIIDRTYYLQRELFSSPQKNPFDCIDDLLDVLKQAIFSRKPFSLVRLGDGEGRILGYPDVFDETVYLNQVLTYQFGPSVLKALKLEFPNNHIEESMLQLKSFIVEAIQNADVIGAPSWLHFRATLGEDNFIPQVAQSVCLDYVSQLKNTPKVFDHFIFKPFHKNNLFDELLSEVDELTVISHTDISEKLKKRFNLKTCKHISIPGHQSFMKSDRLHYPLEYKNVLSEINKVQTGSLVFVAAGYLGKLYCSQIKIRGSIGVDIGSIFDGWCGIGRQDSIGNTEQRI